MVVVMLAVVVVFSFLKMHFPTYKNSYNDEDNADNRDGSMIHDLKVTVGKQWLTNYIPELGENQALNFLSIILKIPAISISSSCHQRR